MILPDGFTTNSTIPAPRKYRLEAYAANGMLVHRLLKHLHFYEIW